METTIISSNIETLLWENVNNIMDKLDISQETRKEYKYRIKLFVEYVKINGFNDDTLLNFKRYLKDDEKSSLSTKCKYFAVTNMFLKELYRLNYLKKDYTVGIKGFNKGNAHKKDGFNELEIKLILNAVNNLDGTLENIRVTAIIYLLIYQGLRQVEIVRLNFEDINLLQQTSNILGKGRDDKELIHLNPLVLPILKLHIEANNIKSGALFKGINHNHSYRLTTETIRSEVNKVIKPLKINKTIHGFRHYYITKLLETMKIKDVRKFSRHKNLEMLVVYDDELDLKKKSKVVFKAFENL